MALFEDMERLKLHFLTAFQKLAAKGVFNEEQLEDIIQLVDKLDDMSVAEIKEKLGRYIPDLQLGDDPSRVADGGAGDGPIA